MEKTALLTICACLGSLFCGAPSFALTVPERLVYDISWTGVKAGTAVQQVSMQGGELHIVSTTRSASWLKIFFPVDDRTESILLPGAGSEHIGVPKSFTERISEGSYRTQKEAQFDLQKLTVSTKDLLKKKEKVDTISNRTFDTLSSIYFVRSTDLVPGRSIYIDIYDCKRLWNTEVKVLRREEIETPLGRFKTLVVRPLLKSEGLFARTGEVTVWLTDDKLRLPVMMTTKIKIGKITATLVGGSYWPQAGE